MRRPGVLRGMDTGAIGNKEEAAGVKRPVSEAGWVECYPPRSGEKDTTTHAESAEGDRDRQAGARQEGGGVHGEEGRDEEGTGEEGHGPRQRGARQRVQ